jgi:hypothetical protein
LSEGAVAIRQTQQSHENDDEKMRASRKMAAGFLGKFHADLPKQIDAIFEAACDAAAVKNDWSRNWIYGQTNDATIG